MPRPTSPPRRPALTFALACLAAAAALLAGCAKQATYATPDAAVEALVCAVQDRDSAALQRIFGPEGKPLLSSGDPVADQHQREIFLAATAQEWTLVPREGGGEELVIGHEQWPFPVPLVHGTAGWRFDSEAGRQEVLARRIGRNELGVIALCRIYVAAQREYASSGHDGRPAGAYARRLVSEPGRHDGLYWPAAPGEAPSPLGELAAQAGVEGYTGGVDAAPRPFRGYLFRILDGQGPAAQGGARSYLRDGVMSGGYALIAWPAEYRNSGVMTFMVSDAGVIYESDLGPETARVAPAISAFDPGPGWIRVE